MPSERNILRDWHRLFGLLLTDFFTGSPFIVEVERDLSQQQQFLDVVILRRGKGRFIERLPDGFDRLVAHNLITFKSHHEALDAWAMKELIGHYVAYRKLVSPSRADLVPEDQFRLFAICARSPQQLPGQDPWQERQPGVYDCLWGTDVIRVIVAGELSREAHNAPLHLFSASRELVGFGTVTYRTRSETTSLVLGQLINRFRNEGFVMSFTMEDFKRELFEEHFGEMTPEEKKAWLNTLPPAMLEGFLKFFPSKTLLEGVLKTTSPEDLLERLPVEEIREFLDKKTKGVKSTPRKKRRENPK